jgi:hypothetical protein
MNDEFATVIPREVEESRGNAFLRRLGILRLRFASLGTTGLQSFGLRHSFLIRTPTFVICVAFVALSLFAEPPPSAKEILDSVRMVESRQQIDLQGQLRQDDMVIPFRLVQTGPLIRYSFANPDEILQLRLGENSSRLDLVTDAGAEKVGASKLQEQIRGTIVTYGDLAFKFLLA